MTLKAVSGAWRGFSLAKETAFGAIQTVDTSLCFGGEPFDTEPGKVWTNADEFTGDIAPTQTQALTWKMEGKHSQLASPHNLALFLAWLMNSCASAQESVGPPAVYKHKVSMAKSVIECPTRTVREFDGANYLEYPGVACAQVSVSCDREDFVKLEATMIGMGKETIVTPDPTRPAQVAESYLTFGDADIKKGGTYNGTAVTGGTSIAARVRNFKLDLGNGAKMAYLFNDPTGFAGRAIRGRLLSAALELSLEFEDRSEKTALMDGSTFVLEIPVIGKTIQSTYKYEARFIFPKVAYSKAKKGVDDGLLLLNAGFNVLADSTYGALDIWIQNSQPSYL